MENQKLCLGILTGSIDKLTAAGIIISGAIADDMEVEVFALMHGARAFLKNLANDPTNLPMAENSNLRSQFENALKQLKVNYWLDFFKQAKQMGNVKIHICGLAGKIWGGYKLDDFVDIADDIVGIHQYITAIQEADVHILI